MGFFSGDWFEWMKSKLYSGVSHSNVASQSNFKQHLQLFLLVLVFCVQGVEHWIPFMKDRLLCIQVPAPVAAVTKYQMVGDVKSLSLRLWRVAAHLSSQGGV